MSKKVNTKIIVLAVVAIIVLVGYSSFKNTYNSLLGMDQEVKAQWSQVENVYQRRMDLIPNLVETVKAYASHESETFTQIAEARSQAGGTMQVSDDVLNNPESFARFQEAQSSIGSALQRLMVVSENYPELKANENYLALQDQLEGTENRIAVERKRFNDAVQSYNSYRGEFPRVMLANSLGYDEKVYFQAAEGASVAPQVSF